MKMTSRASMSVNYVVGDGSKQWVPPLGNDVFRHAFYDDFKNLSTSRDRAKLFGQLRMSPTKAVKETLIRDSLKKLSAANKLSDDQSAEWEREIKRLSDVSKACSTCEELMLKISMNASHHEDPKPVALAKSRKRREDQAELRAHLEGDDHSMASSVPSLERKTLWFLPDERKRSHDDRRPSVRRRRQDLDEVRRNLCGDLDQVVSEEESDDSEEVVDLTTQSDSSSKQGWSNAFVAANIGSKTQVTPLDSCRKGTIVIAKAVVTHQGSITTYECIVLNEQN